MPEPTTITAEPGQRSVIITRIFDAPARLVYEAVTRPEHVRRWWGPCNSELVVCEMDFRVGGAWRHVLRFPDGTQSGFHGEYREIVPYQRVVQTWIYDPYPDSVAVESSEMTEHGGVTKLTITLVHPTVEARDSHLMAGMEHGVNDSHQRLDEVLRSLQRAA